MNNWKPIETAPKDGRQMLLLSIKYFAFVHVGYWSRKEERWEELHFPQEIRFVRFWQEMLEPPSNFADFLSPWSIFTHFLWSRGSCTSWSALSVVNFPKDSSWLRRSFPLIFLPCSTHLTKSATANSTLVVWTLPSIAHRSSMPSSNGRLCIR